MLEKFITIKRLGRFHNYNVNGDSTFKKINLIYADNGMGKTTLTSILRSIKENNARHLLRRKQVNQTQTPEILLRAFGNNYHFQNQQWSGNFEAMEIFDSEFINENVFSGSIVQLDHKRNLYHFVIGEEGVSLANEVNRLDSEIRICTQEIHRLNIEIQKQIKDNFSFDEFINLKNIENVEEIISNKETDLEISKNAESINRQSNLNVISLPPIDIEILKSIIEDSIDNISNTTETKIQQHINTNLDSSGESWLQNGTAYIKDSNCPFCRQDITTNELVALYKDYFSDGYKEFRENLVKRENDYLSKFTENEIGNVISTITNNEVLKIFWSKYVVINLSALELNTIKEIFYKVKIFLNSIFEIKNRNSLEKYSITKEHLALIDSYNTILEQVKSYNEGIFSIQKRIAARKAQSSTVNISQIESEILKLKNIPIRYSDVVNRLCENYLSTFKRKGLLENDKNIAKDKLDRQTEKIFYKYQQIINNYLDLFGVRFRISDASRSYSGGKPSLKYFLVLEETLFDPTTESNEEICFSAALSEGDKSSLAFAFFIAKMKLDENISNKIIVFDDPINSMGNHRRNCTVQEIAKISQNSLQTLVLSHDPFFLREFYEVILGNEFKLFKIIRVTDGVDIIPNWNIINETSGRYFENYNTLVDYLNGNHTTNLLHVAQCIRPLLEGNLKIRFPKYFKQHEWLGDYLKKIRESTKKDEIFLLNDIYSELDAINTYSKVFHHDQNQNIDGIMINDDALQAFVQRTLKVLSGVFRYVDVAA